MIWSQGYPIFQAQRQMQSQSTKWFLCGTGAHVKDQQTQEEQETREDAIYEKAEEKEETLKR